MLLGRLLLFCVCSVFAFMLLAFELRFKWTEPWIKSQFGFMYSYMGRTVFLILSVQRRGCGTQQLQCVRLMMIEALDDMHCIWRD